VYATSTPATCLILWGNLSSAMIFCDKRICVSWAFEMENVRGMAFGGIG
jgi:hypothetical protein